MTLTLRMEGEAGIGVRAGKAINRFKVEKHFRWWMDEAGIFHCQRNAEAIASEACLDGFYVIRTSLPAQTLDRAGTVTAYKRLSRVERAFRRLRTVDLKVRPVFHRTEVRVRAHVFLCMLALHVEWHMRRRLAPVLFEDDDRGAAKARRGSPVEPAEVSGVAEAKADTKRTADGLPVHSLPVHSLPVHSLRTLLADLGPLTLNDASLGSTGQPVPDRL